MVFMKVASHLICLSLISMLVSCILSCSEKPSAEKPATVPKLTYSNPDKMSDTDKQLAEEAYLALCKECSALFVDWNEDIDSVTVYGITDCSNKELAQWDNRCTDYGWGKYVYITAKIKDETKHIPDSYRAWGNTEHYYIGGPNNSGVEMVKFPGFCKEKENNGANVLKKSQSVSKIFKHGK